MILYSLADFYPLYFLILLLFLFAAWIRSFKVAVRSYKDLSLNELLPIVFITLLGFLVRIRFSSHIDLDPYGWRYIQDALATNNFFLPFLKASTRITDALHVPGYSFLISLPLLFSKSLEVVSVINTTFSALTISIVYLITQVVTKDRLTSLLASAMLAFSPVHITYSGFEFPMSFSVFFVSLEFLYLVLWLESKDKLRGWIFILLFLVSINIKIENMIYGILFVALFIYSCLENRELRYRVRDYFRYFPLMTFLSFLYIAPFVMNQAKVQHRLFGPTLDSVVGLDNFIRNNRLFIIQRLHGLPLVAATGYVLLRFSKKTISPYKISLVFAWLLASLLNFFYFIPINAEWNLLQILIPVYIIIGFVATQSLRLVIKNNSLRNISVIFLIFLFSIRALQTSQYGKNYSWKNLKRDLKTKGDNEEIISLKVRTSEFALRFLFPEKKWIFLEGDALGYKVNKLRRNLYYFNPVPYGLTEEADQRKVAEWENILRENYNFTPASDRIVFFELTRKT